MSRQVLTKIPPLHAELVPDQNWERAGTTPDGKQLYIERSRRSRAKPMIDDRTGKRVWKRHPVTAEPLYPRNVPELYTKERMFYLESDGRGNVLRHDWRPPTPEEIAAHERRARVEAMGGGALGEALVDAGITDPQEAVRRLFGGNGQAAETAAAPDTDEATDDVGFPQWKGRGGWELSDGSRITREDDEDADDHKARALAAELTLQRKASAVVTDEPDAAPIETGEEAKEPEPDDEL